MTGIATRFGRMFLGMAALSAAPYLISAPANAAVVEKVIGKWDWNASTGNSNPLANEVNPGTYNAVAQNSATAGSGLANIARVAGNSTDKFFNLGHITELEGARYFRMTFENVTFSNFEGADTSRQFILAGSTSSSLNSATNTFYLFFQLNRASDGQGGYTAKPSGWAAALWGKDKDGNDAKTGNNYQNNAQGGLTYTATPGTAYDLEYIYESTGTGQSATAKVTFNIQEHGANNWTTVQVSSPVVQLNPLHNDVYLGKYLPASSLIKDETIGATTLAVELPEPASLGLLSVGVATLLLRRHARR